MQFRGSHLQLCFMHLKSDMLKMAKPVFREEVQQTSKVRWIQQLAGLTTSKVPNGYCLPLEKNPLKPLSMWLLASPAT